MNVTPVKRCFSWGHGFRCGKSPNSRNSWRISEKLFSWRYCFCCAFCSWGLLAFGYSLKKCFFFSEIPSCFRRQIIVRTKVGHLITDKAQPKTAAVVVPFYSKKIMRLLVHPSEDKSRFSPGLFFSMGIMSINAFEFQILICMLSHMGGVV